MYLGHQDPNAILRGDIPASPGDSFYFEGSDGFSRVAFRFNPLARDSKEPAYKNFAILHRGVRAIEAAERNEQIPFHP